MMKAVGNTSRQIFESFRIEAQKAGTPPRFLLSDVQNAFRPSPDDAWKDANNTIIMLKARSEKSNLLYDFRLDAGGRLDLLFAEMLHAKSVLAAAGNTVCVQFDTTFGTNSHDCKLGLFTIVNKHLTTSVIAASVLAGDEDTDKFQWILQQFKSCFMR
jgi:hypothetical protein